MTWEELCNKAKEMGYEYSESYMGLEKYGCPFLFHKTGNVRLKSYITIEGIKSKVYTNDFHSFCIIIAENRTPEQMLTIMEALR